MADKVKFCIVCGRRIPELSLRRKVCSDFCRRRYKSGYTPFINFKNPPFSELTEMQMKASEKGMSYGQYVASLTNSERSGKENGK